MDLELADSRTKVLTSSKGLESWARSVESLERQTITAPVDFDTLLLQGEEYDQGRKCNGARESGGSDTGRGKKIRHHHAGG